MKSIFTILLIVVSISSFGQTTYYFSSNGSDSNTGKSTAAPFKTISKLNQLSLLAGDKLLFRAGETFNGQINIKASGTKDNPIEISSYGTGRKPIISGAKAVGNWAKVAGKPNVWVAACDKDTAVSDLYMNSRPLPLGRFPNKNDNNHGYLIVAGHNGKTEITSKDAINANWKDAELVFKPNEYLIEKPKISAVNGNTFTVSNEQYAAFDGWGYFIQNALGTLDQNGEWFYDVANKKVYIYSDAFDPNQKNIEITYFSKGIYLVNSNFITVKNIEIAKTCNTSIYSYKSSNILLRDLDINYSGEDGIKFFGDCSDIKLDNVDVNHCNNNGVVAWNTSNFTFINSSIKNCGMLPGRGKSNNGAYIGFQYQSKIGHAIISNNVIDSIGYNALEFRSPNVLISKNSVSNFCLIKADGGGIYTYNADQNNFDNMIVSQNIVSGGRGDSISINHVRPHIYGIYMDDCTSNVKIIGNTVMNCQASGIFLHGNSNIIVDSNTFYNNNAQYYNGFGRCDSKNNTITNNIFVSTNKNQPVSLLLTHNNNSAMGDFTNNIYYSPDKEHMITIMPDAADQSKTKRMSVDSWKSQYNIESLARVIKSPLQNNAPPRGMMIKYNSTNATKNISLDGSYTDMKGNDVGSEVTLKPFSSIVLVKQ